MCGPGVCWHFLGISISRLGKSLSCDKGFFFDLIALKGALSKVNISHFLVLISSALHPHGTKSALNHWKGSMLCPISHDLS